MGVPTHGVEDVLKMAHSLKKQNVPSSSFLGAALEPLAPLADQPVWQAAEPMTINVDYDVPTHGVADVLKKEDSLKKQNVPSSSFLGAALEPLAPLADQPVWQAAEPMTVNVDYDVPTHGVEDVLKMAHSLKKQNVRSSSFLGAALEPLTPLADQPVWQAAEPMTVNVDYDVPTHGVEDVLKMAHSLKKQNVRSSSFLGAALEPLAPLADQPVWQAAEPMTVNVDYDVPTHGVEDVLKMAHSLKKQNVPSSSFLGASLEPLAPLADQPVWQAAEPMTVNVDYDVPTHGVEDVMKKTELSHVASLRKSESRGALSKL